MFPFVTKDTTTISSNPNPFLIIDSPTSVTISVPTTSETIQPDHTHPPSPIASLSNSRNDSLPLFDPTLPSQTSRRSTRQSKPPIWMKDFIIPTQAHGPSNNTCLYSLGDVLHYDSSSPSYQSSITKFSADIEPKSHVQSAKDPRWVEAMEMEVKALEYNNTWEVVALHFDKRVIGCK